MAPSARKGVTIAVPHPVVSITGECIPAGRGNRVQWRANRGLIDAEFPSSPLCPILAEVLFPVFLVFLFQH
jgi:hypothetical protein